MHGPLREEVARFVNRDCKAGNMATQRDYYDILGIERNASGGDVSSAYRKLAIKCHPDSNPNDEEAFKYYGLAAELGITEAQSNHPGMGTNSRDSSDRPF